MSTDAELAELLAKAKEWNASATYSEKCEMALRQKKSWLIGELGLAHPDISPAELEERVSRIDAIWALSEIDKFRSQMKAQAAEIERLKAAAEPLARLEIPKWPQGNSGIYSIRHSDIIRAQEATRAQPTLPRKSVFTEPGAVVPMPEGQFVEQKSRVFLLYDWAYVDELGRGKYAGTPYEAQRLAGRGIKLTPVYTIAENQGEKS